MLANAIAERFGVNWSRTPEMPSPSDENHSAGASTILVRVHSMPSHIDAAAKRPHSRKHHRQDARCCRWQGTLHPCLFAVCTHTHMLRVLYHYCCLVGTAGCLVLLFCCSCCCGGGLFMFLLLVRGAGGVLTFAAAAAAAASVCMCLCVCVGE